MSLAPYVRILGRGPGRSRSLTRDEAREAMASILSGQAEPEAIGALLMLMRFRGECADEIAGFVDAMRARLPDWAKVDAAVDWPSYAAGRTRGRPYFLLSARLIAQAGYPVLLHGWNSHQNPLADVRSALDGLGIPVAENVTMAETGLTSAGIVYVPLEVIDPALLHLLKLRDALGLRSAVNTALRVLNPSLARASVQGVFHPPYRDLQCVAGELLAQPALTVIKGGAGEFERNPAKAVALHRLAAGRRSEETAPPIVKATRRLSENASDMPPPDALWRGETADPFAEAIVLGTAAVALLTLGAGETLDACQSEAAMLWRSRHHRAAA